MLSIVCYRLNCDIDAFQIKSFDVLSLEDVFLKLCVVDNEARIEKKTEPEKTSDEVEKKKLHYRSLPLSLPFCCIYSFNKRVDGDRTVDPNSCRPIRKVHPLFRLILVFAVP